MAQETKAKVLRYRQQQLGVDMAVQPFEQASCLEIKMPNGNILYIEYDEYGDSLRLRKLSRNNNSTGITIAPEVSNVIHIK